ncbi:hypothetical protein E2C01_020579 [Portunus trituberculatus]|uniref:Uncharacterized protein n=1 Tax=Portunus trituberculatus TaxID=210409 RepID=A0A5B7E1X1_PORTR|nr:hypothetical protein [Portunus trituberculatus]
MKGLNVIKMLRGKKVKESGLSSLWSLKI